MLENYWVASQLAASEEGRFYFGLVLLILTAMDLNRLN
jgi:hypothetical protein